MSNIKEVKGVGNVEIRELTVKEAQPFMDGTLEGNAVVRFLLSNSLYINGNKLGDGVDNLTVRQYKTLSGFLNDILIANGLKDEDEPAEGEEVESPKG